MKLACALGLSISALAMSAPSHAAVLIQFDEVGNDVVATTSGSLDLTGLTFQFSGIGSGGLIPDAGTFINGSGAADVYSGLSGVSFGTGGATAVDAFIGDLFGFVSLGSQVGVPAGYVSNTPINAVTTFFNSSFASLGITPGTYQFTVPNDTITLQAGAVPEPSTWAIMILGFLGIGAALRSSNKGKVSVTYA